MTVVRTIADLRRCLSQPRAQGRIGLVPTMGALHDGHVSLVRAARREVATVVATVFVNQKQFGDEVDYLQYPRDERGDADVAVSAGVDVLFMPSDDEFYPDGHATSIESGGAALGFEGYHRPGHFNGVSLVCMKLFCLVDPDTVYLGQKDAQQVAVLRQLVRDLNVCLEIRVVPTVRDADGLALSSRNTYLTADDRSRALAIPHALRAAVAAHRQGRDPIASARGALGDLAADYLEVAVFDGEPTLVLAARAGTTRLIDNVPLDRPELAGLEVPRR